jgi:hypothetical protein
VELVDLRIIVIIGRQKTAPNEIKPAHAMCQHDWISHDRHLPDIVDSKCKSEKNENPGKAARPIRPESDTKKLFMK